MVVFTLFKNSSNKALTDVAYFVLTVGAIGLVILVYNILPFRIDSMTDGYRLTMVSNPKNRAAFNELLRVEYEIQQGNQDVEVKIFDEITNFTADLNLNKVYALLDKKEYAAAEEILDKIIAAKDGVDAKVYIRARAQKIYINLITRNLEEAKAYYDKEVPVSERREISNDVSMASIRAYLLMSGLLDKSRSECIIALNNVYKAFKKTPKNRQATELTLFNEALDKVIAAHPDWELEGYKLQVAEK
jgi:tetratricopeptide (TPR) repeat protein